MFPKDYSEKAKFVQVWDSIGEIEQDQAKHAEGPQWQHVIS